MTRAKKLAEEIAVTAPRKQPPRPRKPKPDAKKVEAKEPVITPGPGSNTGGAPSHADGSPDGVSPEPRGQPEPKRELGPPTGDRNDGWFLSYLD